MGDDPGPAAREARRDAFAGNAIGDGAIYALAGLAWSGPIGLPLVRGRARRRPGRRRNRGRRGHAYPNRWRRGTSLGASWSGVLGTLLLLRGVGARIFTQ